MNSLRIFAVLVLLSLVAIPALGELTDYQKGVSDGLAAGMRIGRLLGAAPFDPNQAQQYDNQVDAFNRGLAAAFGNNQTALNMFWMQPYGSSSGYSGMTLQNFTNTKPIHAIDASFNQTKRINPDITGKYYGYDLDTYIAMTGHVPTNIPEGGSIGENAYDSLGKAP
jgi:hypothetical protein